MRSMQPPKKDSLFGCAIGAWLMAVVLNLAFWGAVIYIVLHFVLKAW